MDQQDGRYRKLVELGIALSAERNHQRLLEMLLLGAKEITAADGATLYMIDSDERVLRFEILRNDSLGLAQGGTSDSAPNLPPVPLYDASGAPNHRNVAAHCANAGATINIADAYAADDKFDFSGVKAFDARTGYRSRAFLTVPLKDHRGRISGVLQLINPPGEGAFPLDVVPVVEALASQAAVALDNWRLLKAQKQLFHAFVRVISAAIDAKSAYTGGHCQRVPVLTEMLTRAATEQTQGPFAGFTLTDDEWFELQVAAWLHDCGKVTTPEYVVDKSTKLETIHDRIHEVKARFAALRHAAERDFWRAVAEGGDRDALQARLDRRLAKLDDDRRFVEEINLGGEFMAPDKIERLAAVAAERWVDAEGRERPLLDDDEVANLSVARGTLTDAERQIINDHIVMTIRMLEQLPFPEDLRRVVEYAGGHHEKMDGTGYPNGLTREQMAIPTRAMAIADIFEALTAADRPYKKAKTLSETIRIMSFMKKDNHIDPDLFDLFLTSGVYRDYAARFLAPEQIDAVDVAAYVGAPAPAGG